MSNYTREQTDFIVGTYSAEPCMETVKELAEKIGKSPKSVIGKLSREGVYQRSVYVTKTGAPPVTKIEFCLLYTSPSPRDLSTSRMPSSA